MHSLGTQTVIVEHRRVQVVTQHADQLTLLVIDGLLNFKARYFLTINFSHAATATTKKNGLYAKKGKRNNDKADDNFGGGALGAFTNILQHDSYYRLWLLTKKRTRKCALETSCRSLFAGSQNADRRERIY